MDKYIKNNALYKIYQILSIFNKKNGLIVLVLIIIGMFLEILSVGLIIPIFSFFSNDDKLSKLNYAINSNFYLKLNGNDLILIGLSIFLLIYFLKALAQTYITWKQTSYAYDIQKNISYELFKIYLNKPYIFHLNKNSAQLIRNVINEVSLFTFEGILPCMVLISELLIVSGLILLLFLVETKGALIVLGIMALTVIFYYTLSKGYIFKLGKQRKYHEGLRIQHLQQGLGGIKDILVLGVENEFLEQYNIHNINSSKMGKLNGTIHQLPKIWIELICVLSILLLISSMILDGKSIGTTIPILLVFSATAFRMLPSISRIIASIHSLRYGLPITNMLYEDLILDKDNFEFKDKNESGEFIFKGEIEILGVQYQYEGIDKIILDDISLRIKKGDMVGIIGESGAGKSTLVDIVLGLLEPTLGAIRVDGVDIKDRLRSWQHQIGYVPQHIFLIDESIKKNIAFGLEEKNIDPDSMAQAIKAARLDKYITSLPDGIETQVGERGVRLSGGQRQRIGIARAYYNNPSVLIFDEATSALDVETEREIMNEVLSFQGKKTIIIITHRHTTLENCDHILKIDHGKIQKIH